jgi:hypothetical protein
MSTSIYDEIRDERAYQDAKWGGPDHDDDHGEEEWFDYIEEYAQGYRGKTRNLSSRARLIAIAALAVAAVESMDRLAGEVAGE